MTKNPLLELSDLGQSVWLDYIRRAFIASGELQKLITEDGLKGVTSNPSIFEKAIGGSTDYNDAMKKAVSEGKGVQEIYDILVLEDIGKAADLFLPVYKKTNGVDGYVSIEVSPELARDTQGSIKEARRLFSLLKRPNIMVKIPGTPEGIPAIETLIGEGININITLLFGIENYEQVMEAYLKGLEKRVKAGEAIANIASVASFFVSRVDTLVDSLLEEKLKTTSDSTQKEKIQKLLGKTAVANAKLAYQKFKEVFGNARFQALKAKGAQVQRPLWASTSTKNPKYSDTLYVTDLIAKESVNTIPTETLAAFRDHGKARLTIEENVEEAKATFQTLKEVGINLKQVTQKLQDDGVVLFSDAFTKLMHSIATKREAFLGGLLDKQVLNIGEYAAKVQSTIEQLEKSKFIKQLWNKEATLWKNEPAHIKEIKERLGWLTVTETMKEQSHAIQQFVEGVKKEGIKDVVLLGMGGSSLCPEVFRHTFGKINGYPTLHVLDSTDPATISEVEKHLDIKKTLFIVSSKSGGTTETDSLYKYFYEKNPNGNHFIAITDPGTSLEALAKNKKFRHVFVNPPDIGGRYSALSYFGLIPGALMGLDVKKLLECADRMIQSCVPWVPTMDNPGAILGVVLAELYKGKRDKITFITPRPLHTLGTWLEQLLAESTGKEGKGLVPIALEPLADVKAYGNDRLFVYIYVQSHQEELSEQRVKELEKAGQPVVRITLEDPYDLAEEFFRWEFATAVAGALMGIDAFDQPNVQESKDNTKALLQEFQKNGKLPEEQPISEENGLKIYADTSQVGKDKTVSGCLSNFLNLIKPGDYVALMAYIQANDANDKKLEAIRAHLVKTLHVATTLGYGPRFLHSTGQLHKGGANNGVFIQFTADDIGDLKIPGEPFSFSVLKHAQSMGDFRSLQKHQRRAIHVHLGKEISAGLQKFLSLLQESVIVKSN